MPKYIPSEITSRVSINEETGCWHWLKYKDKDGYGRFGRKCELAHRAAYRAFHGEFDKKLCVLHRCDNRVCVNPDHLFLGTQKDNLSDMYSKNRQNLSGLLRGHSHEEYKRIAQSIPRENGRFARKGQQ